jgi:FeS assembly SUF system protein
MMMRDKIIEALRDVYDPEIPVNIYDIGLVYEINVGESGEVGIVMTLTSPMCPVAEWMPQDVEAKVSAVEGVSSVTVEVVWDPPWDPEMMSEAARLELGMF